MFLFVYLALLIRLIMPTVYQTVRVSILGNLPDTSQINIASQMAWVNVVIEIIDESLILPLYFCLGDSINDANITKKQNQNWPDNIWICILCLQYSHF